MGLLFTNPEFSDFQARWIGRKKMFLLPVQEKDTILRLDLYSYGSNCRHIFNNTCAMDISFIPLISITLKIYGGSKSLQTENGIDEYVFNPLHTPFPFHLNKKSIYIRGNRIRQSTFMARATMTKIFTYGQLSSNKNYSLPTQTEKDKRKAVN